MKVQIQEKGDVVIIAPAGQITFDEVADLRAQFEEAWRRPQHAVLLNLGEVDYLDSSGIAALVEGLKEAQRAGRLFGLCDLRKAVRNVIELVRLDTVFNIYEDEDGAVKAMTNPPEAESPDSAK